MDSKARYKNMALLIDILDNALAKKSRDEWGKLFDEAKLIWGPVMALHEVPQDPHALEIGMFPKINHPVHGDYTSVNIPMRFTTADVKPRGPAPLKGEHTEQVLAASGLSEAEIAELKAANIVGSG
jgi:crotonobetainyl-CoA:carnitine CoA-transferase CaiB-like acyl-CoA transferase